MAHAFMRQQHMVQAEQAAKSTVVVMAPRAEAPACPPEELSLLGAMNLVLAVINAREGNRGQTHAHIDRAQERSARLGEDQSDFDTEFGPTNVEIHAVSTAVELGDAGLAPEVAQQVAPAGLSPERQARFLLGVARTHAQRRHVGEATAALLEAEALTPEQIHDHHLARELIRDLIQLSEPRVSESLRELAERSAVGWLAAGHAHGALCRAGTQTLQATDSQAKERPHPSACAAPCSRRMLEERRGTS